MYVCMYTGIKHKYKVSTYCVKYFGLLRFLNNFKIISIFHTNAWKVLPIFKVSTGNKNGGSSLRAIKSHMAHLPVIALLYLFQ